jgi:hypothetical protein
MEEAIKKDGRGREKGWKRPRKGIEEESPRKGMEEAGKKDGRRDERGKKN